MSEETGPIKFRPNTTDKELWLKWYSEDVRLSPTRADERLRLLQERDAPVNKPATLHADLVGVFGSLAPKDGESNDEYALRIIRSAAQKNMISIRNDGLGKVMEDILKLHRIPLLRTTQTS